MKGPSAVSRHEPVPAAPSAQPAVDVASVIYVGSLPAGRRETKQSLAAAGFAVVWADSAGSVRQLQGRYAAILFDFANGPAALQIARELADSRRSPPAFAVVDAERPDQSIEAVLAGVADVLVHPLSGRRLTNAIDRAQSLVRDGRRNVDGDRPGPEDLYVCSAAMRETAAQIELAAATRTGVTIRGEDGAGRRVVARAVHDARQSQAPFRSIDCAALEGAPLEVVLFGTDASHALATPPRGLETVSRRGLLHEVNGGTLYLQSLPEAPARVQARLATILRDREASLVETGDTIAIDVRPMAGFNPDGDDGPMEHRVRPDLYRRLSASSIDVPPLRKRRDDLPALANYFVHQICAQQGLRHAVLCRSALSLLCALPWRHNAIELRQLLETIIGDLGNRREIRVEDLLAHLRLDGDSVELVQRETLRQARIRFEREYITAVLQQHRGRISDAAKVLGIQRTNLHRKMRVLNVGRGKRNQAPANS